MAPVAPIAGHGVRLPIDYFFRSLAEDQGRCAIGVILSGAGTDGTLGLKAIKESGGITLAQKRESAAFASMPKNAANDLTYYKPTTIERRIERRMALHKIARLSTSRPSG